MWLARQSVCIQSHEYEQICFFCIYFRYKFTVNPICLVFGKIGTDDRCVIGPIISEMGWPPQYSKSMSYTLWF